VLVISESGALPYTYSQVLLQPQAWRLKTRKSATTVSSPGARLHAMHRKPLKASQFGNAEHTGCAQTPTRPKVHESGLQSKISPSTQVPEGRAHSRGETSGNAQK